MQTAFWENHGLQCGYCTPGMIMASAAFVRDNPGASEAEIRHYPRRKYLPLHRLSQYRQERSNRWRMPPPAPRMFPPLEKGGAWKGGKNL